MGDEDWTVSWTEVAKRTNQIPEKPPFSMHPVGPLTCKVCGDKVRYGTGWQSDGWMCSTRQCYACGATHIITDSLMFCKACHRKDAACLSYPHIFIRKNA